MCTPHLFPLRHPLKYTLPRFLSCLPSPHFNFEKHRDLFSFTRSLIFSCSLFPCELLPETNLRWKWEKIIIMCLLEITRWKWLYPHPQPPSQPSSLAPVGCLCHKSFVYFHFCERHTMLLTAYWADDFQRETWNWEGWRDGKKRRREGWGGGVTISWCGGHLWEVDLKLGGKLYVPYVNLCKEGFHCAPILYVFVCVSIFSFRMKHLGVYWITFTIVHICCPPPHTHMYQQIWYWYIVWS